MRARKEHLTRRRRFAIALWPVLAISLLVGVIRPAQAAGPSLMPDASAFSLLSPGTLELTLLGGGYVSPNYQTTEEGFQLEQSITRNVGLIGRGTGYQLYVGSGFRNPLAPNSNSTSRYNFGRLQGGFAFHLPDGTNLMLLGGADVADSDSKSFEGDLSRWFLTRSPHPLNIAISTIYTTQNKVFSSEIDLRTVAYATESYVLLAGAGGAIYTGGFVHPVQGQGGPIFGLFLPKWHMGFDLQAGYGAAKEYGEIAFYKQFRWTE